MKNIICGPPPGLVSSFILPYKATVHTNPLLEARCALYDLRAGRFAGAEVSLQ